MTLLMLTDVRDPDRSPTPPAKKRHYLLHRATASGAATAIAAAAQIIARRSESILPEESICSTVGAADSLFAFHSGATPS